MILVACPLGDIATPDGIGKVNMGVVILNFLDHGGRELIFNVARLTTAGTSILFNDSKREIS